jgi:polyhydroxyalkanoate synthase
MKTVKPLSTRSRTRELRALALAFADLQLHLLASPGKQASLLGRAIQNAFDLVDAMLPRHAAFQPWS